MDNNLETKHHIKVSKLASNNDYYNNVFKKTENIVSVIFYILSDTPQSDRYISEYALIKDSAIACHAAALATLRVTASQASPALEALQVNLVALSSVLGIGAATGYLAPEVHTLVHTELDVIQRYLKNHYLDTSGVTLSQGSFSLASTTTMSSPHRASPRSTPSTAVIRPARTLRPKIPAGDISTDAYLVYSQLNDRAERIKTVLDAKPEATIKDIAEVITDVSEKTIQRELNSLIEKGQVIRQGERRWSRYSVTKVS